MKRFVFFGLIAVAFVAAFAQNSAEALQSVKAYKQVVLTVVVTPSPVPIVFLDRSHRNRSVARTLTADPYHGPLQVASIAHFDVPMLVAQATPQGNIPVTFNSKPDPTAAYLHVVPHTSTLMAAYGANTYTCPFEIYAYYTTTWKVTDWGYGTVASGGGTFPIENYPTTSYLAWDIPSIGNTTFTAYANSGSPGQNSFLGTAGISQQNCINLSLTVPSNLPSGTYTAAVQYNLLAN